VVGESPSPSFSIQTIQANGCRWINVERPTSAEVTALADDLGVRRDDLEAGLERGGVPGVWQRPRYALIVLHLPALTPGRGRGVLRAAPVALLIGPDVVVTVHTGELRGLLRWFRQCESDEGAREAAFALGPAGLALVLAQRLLDAAAAARTRVGRDVVVWEDELPRNPNQRVVASLLRLRAEARAIRRLVTPLPRQIQRVAATLPLPAADEDGWDRVSGRAERLVQAIDDDLTALDGVFLAASAAARADDSRYLRVASVVAVLTLPLIALTLLLGLPAGNPLANLNGAYTIAVGLVGGVFLITLAALRRGRLL
jgi:magnesium transporter